jgi:hypothetical protein
VSVAAADAHFMNAAGPQQPVEDDKVGVALSTGGAARARLEQIIGLAFTRQLLAALAPVQGRRGSSSP